MRKIIKHYSIGVGVGVIGVSVIGVGIFLSKRWNEWNKYKKWNKIFHISENNVIQYRQSYYFVPPNNIGRDYFTSNVGTKTYIKYNNWNKWADWRNLNLWHFSRKCTFVKNNGICAYKNIEDIKCVPGNIVRVIPDKIIENLGTKVMFRNGYFFKPLNILNEVTCEDRLKTVSENEALKRHILKYNSLKTIKNYNLNIFNKYYLPEILSSEKWGSLSLVKIMEYYDEYDIVAFKKKYPKIYGNYSNCDNIYNSSGIFTLIPHENCICPVLKGLEN